MIYPRWWRNRMPPFFCFMPLCWTLRRMVALKDKRKWTVAEYKGEHERGSRDMNYYSFHDANPNKWYYSPPCAFSLFLLGPFFFFLSAPEMRQNSLWIQVQYVCSVIAASHHVVCKYICAFNLYPAALQRRREREWASLCAPLCVFYYCCPQRRPLATHLRSDYVCRDLTSVKRTGTDLIAIRLFCSWLSGVQTSHAVCALASLPPPPSFCNYFFFFITEHHNKQVAMCPLPSICLYWSGQ